MWATIQRPCRQFEALRHQVVAKGATLIFIGERGKFR